MSNSITLYSDKVPGAARCIWASVCSTTLRVELQDLGKNVPGGEYEYGIVGISLFMLRKHLNVETNEEVFDWLKVNFNKSSAVDDLMRYLTKNKIHFEAFSF
ncbi:MAG: hypothetical protein NC044_08945 [Prevotella sp.]|nr:hypothetical protein [Bacteroides sp.]MCM1446514.1 hypothetical protein [Prevotella sp.]